MNENDYVELTKNLRVMPCPYACGILLLRERAVNYIWYDWHTYSAHTIVTPTMQGIRAAIDANVLEWREQARKFEEFASTIAHNPTFCESMRDLFYGHLVRKIAELATMKG